MSAQLQSALAAAGFSPGVIDGHNGPKTYAALLNYSAGKDRGVATQQLGIALAADFAKYDIEDNRLRVCHFIGQAHVETGGFAYVEEFGGKAYFTRLYEGRADLGNTKAGDGALYHGRGIFEITGRDNYRRYGKRIGIDLEAHPERACEPAISSLLACLYWTDKSLNAYADTNDSLAIARAINLGNAKSKRQPNHAAERLEATNRLLALWV